MTLTCVETMRRHLEGGAVTMPDVTLECGVIEHHRSYRYYSPATGSWCEANYYPFEVVCVTGCKDGEASFECAIPYTRVRDVEPRLAADMSGSCWLAAVFVVVLVVLLWLASDPRRAG